MDNTIMLSKVIMTRWMKWSLQAKNVYPSSNGENYSIRCRAIEVLLFSYVTSAYAYYFVTWMKRSTYCSNQD